MTDEAGRDPTGDEPATGELVVHRWRRYGHDRLYVKTPDGRQVGWVSLLESSRTVDLEDNAEALDSAVTRWKAVNDIHDEPGSAAQTQTPEASHAEAVLDRSAESAPTGVPSEDHHLVPPLANVEVPDEIAPPVDGAEDAWEDLALRAGGQMARHQAKALRDEAPARTMLARVLRVHTDERAFRIGAAGEEKVARRLNKLPGGWRVVHSVPVGERGSDIDHVVIGPGGVFTLNTKHHPHGRIWVGQRTLMVNGTRTHYLDNSRFEASRASKLLTAACGFDVVVEPILTIIASDFTSKSQPDGVHVFGPRQR